MSKQVGNFEELKSWVCLNGEDAAIMGLGSVPRQLFFLVSVLLMLYHVHTIFISFTIFRKGISFNLDMIETIFP